MREYSVIYTRDGYEDASQPHMPAHLFQAVELQEIGEHQEVWLYAVSGENVAGFREALLANPRVISFIDVNDPVQS